MNNTFERLEQYDFIDDQDIDKIIKKYSELIGKFLILFSCLEHELNLAIAEFINERTHQMGYLMIERMAISDKIDLFNKMFLGLESATGKRNKKILDRIKQSMSSINAFRNQIAHANWLTMSITGYVRTKIIVDNKEGHIKFKKILITPKLIRDKIKEIKKLNKLIDNYKEKAFQF